MSSATTSVDLTDITAAVGPTIFSYLPLGSLLNGLSSPLLVNKIFRGAILEYLQEATCISFSQCPHLRKINDAQLICLVENMLGESGSLKTKRLDLSKCRNLKGDGIMFCLKSMPNIEWLSVSKATRFHITNNFRNSSLMDAIKHLQHVDVSGCPKLNTQEISCLASTLSGSNIRVLDFSGCSTLIDDDALLSVAEHCHYLESVDVSGSKKLTVFGVAIVSYICRSTLRCLSLHGCESVQLAYLLYSHAMSCPLNVIVQWRESEEDDLSVLRRNLTIGGNNDENSFLTPAYVDVFIKALQPLSDGPAFARERRRSENLMRLCREYEERWGQRYGWAERHDEHSLFGQLEKLDLSNTAPKYSRLVEPVLMRTFAIISWLNKGKLREINLSGLAVPPDVVSALAFASGSCLRCIEVSSMLDTHIPTSRPWASLICVRGVCELDLSCCSALINNSTNISEMENLRSLRLDNLLIRDYNVEPMGFLSNTKRLLHLSIKGCTRLKVSVLTKAKAQNPDLNLLELDVRDVLMDVPLSTIRVAYPTLLKLNNRCTELGTSRIQQHRLNYQWRVGARERNSRVSNKRKRGKSQNASQSPVVDSAPLSLDCCSLQLTGFSKADCTEQEMFGCKTCNIEFGRFVCMACSKACHSALGHEVFSIGYGPGYCDCSILSNTCMCIKDLDE